MKDKLTTLVKMFRDPLLRSSGQMKRLYGEICYRYCFVDGILCASDKIHFADVTLGSLQLGDKKFMRPLILISLSCCYYPLRGKVCLRQTRS